MTGVREGARWVVTGARRVVRLTALLGLLGVLGLGALGRFRSALALTLGAAVAIVSALWLSDLVGRLEAPRPGAKSRFDWKFGLKTLLRYAVVGATLLAAVRVVPAEIPWFVVGLSTVVAAVAVAGVSDIRRDARGRRKKFRSVG